MGRNVTSHTSSYKALKWQCIITKLRRSFFPNLINQHPIFKELSSQSREPKSTNAQIISNPVEEVNGGFEKFFIFLFIQSFHLGFGGPTEDRTRDPVIKSHMLYLLSYWSICALSFIKDQSCFGYD